MNLIQLIFLIPALLIGVVLHEYAHGRAAEIFGDPTARQAGRLTLNPIPHLDPFGSILVPLLLYVSSGGRFFFAAAKPVPINPMYFKHGRRDLFWVGLAGPATNIVVAAVSGLIARPVWGILPLYGQLFVYELVTVNLILAIFNLIPVPPLDGSRLVEAVIPSEYLPKYKAIEPYGILIVFGVLFFFSGIFWGVVGPVLTFLSRLFLPEVM